MIPIGDDNTGRRRTPVVTWLLIALNVAVFLLLQSGPGGERFTYAFSVVPREIVTGVDVAAAIPVRDPQTGAVVATVPLQPTPIPVYLTLLTAMFMHGGFAHLFGNMLYLWIFGDNVEDDMGPGRYLAFYLVCGLLAGLAHVAATAWLGGDMDLPSLGASGAISGVLAAYMMLHPHRRVRVLVWRIIQEVPAVWVIGFWFLFQLLSGVGAAGAAGGGVAYGAHIGGFVAGLALVHVFVPRRRGR